MTQKPESPKPNVIQPSNRAWRQRKMIKPREFRPFGKHDVTWGKKRLNTDHITCHKCEVPWKEGEPVHKQRHFFYHMICWLQAYLDVED